MDQSTMLKFDFTLTFFISLVASQANRAPVTIKYLKFVPDAVTSPHPVSSYESIHAHDQEGKESVHIITGSIGQDSTHTWARPLPRQPHRYADYAWTEKLDTITCNY